MHEYVQACAYVVVFINNYLLLSPFPTLFLSSTQAIKTYFGTQQMWLVLGLTQGVKGLLSFLSAPLIGALSDNWGRKPFLLLTVGCTCFPLPFLFLENLWWHVIAVALSGAFAVTFSVVFAYVSDVTQPADRSAAYGQVC